MQKETRKLLNLILITIAVFSVSLICLSHGIYIVYQYFFLVPIIIACFWYKKKGVVYSVIIASAHIFLYSYYTHENFPEEIGRLLLFTAIAVILDILVERLDQKNKEISKLNKKLQNRLEMMKKSEELSGMGSWRLDIKTNKMAWSDGLYKIFGFNPVSTKPSLEKRFEITYPDDLEAVKNSILDSINKRENTKLESRIIKPDGKMRWISSIGYTEYDENGEPETYIGSFHDVTEQRLYERELYNEQEKFKVTLASIGDGVIATDVKGNITIINNQAEKLTGWEAKDAVEKPFDTVFNIINESTRTKCESPIQRVLRSGLIIGLANHTALISKFGTEYSIADSAAPIKDNKGNILGVVIVFRNVTEEKKRQDEINYISYHDSLTGLYNRRFFEEQLGKIDTEKNLPISVIMGDVNGLKITNDAFGHVEGDHLLQKAAEAMQAACRSTDIVARWGGDEYVILLPHTSQTEAEQIIARITKIESSMKVGPINVSVSFGCGTKEKEDESLFAVWKNAEDRMYEKKLTESENMRRRFIKNVLETLRDESPDQIGHFVRVGELSQQIGRAMHLPEKEITKLKLAARLHDIGKVAIDKSILTKRGSLTQQEWDDVKRHPDIGYKILKSSKRTAGISEYVLAHHERYDGKGYPAGLKGDKIPLLSRIITVADSFDAMTHDRNYRKAMSREQAEEELIQNKGTQFDPDVVDAAMEVICGKQ